MRSGTGGGAFTSLCTAVPPPQKKKKVGKGQSRLSYPSLSPRRDVLERTLGTRLGKGFGQRLSLSPFFSLVEEAVVHVQTRYSQDINLSPAA